MDHVNFECSSLYRDKLPMDHSIVNNTYFDLEYVFTHVECISYYYALFIDVYCKLSHAPTNHLLPSTSTITLHVCIVYLNIMMDYRLFYSSCMLCRFKYRSRFFITLCQSQCVLVANPCQPFLLNLKLFFFFLKLVMKIFFAW